eukprot:2625169-Rhodomonas_salina.2
MAELKHLREATSAMQKDVVRVEEQLERIVRSPGLPGTPIRPWYTHVLRQYRSCYHRTQRQYQVEDSERVGRKRTCYVLH